MHFISATACHLTPPKKGEAQSSFAPLANIYIFFNIPNYGVITMNLFVASGLKFCNLKIEFYQQRHNVGNHKIWLSMHQIVNCFIKLASQTSKQHSDFASSSFNLLTAAMKLLLLSVLWKHKEDGSVKVEILLQQHITVGKSSGKTWSGWYLFNVWTQYWIEGPIAGLLVRIIVLL